MISMLVILAFAPMVMAKEKDQTIDIAFFVDYVTINPIDSIYFDVEAQILTRDQAIEKAKLRQKFEKERDNLYAKHPQPDIKDKQAVDEWNRQIEADSVEAKRLLVEMMEIHGPKATVRLFRYDCSDFKQGTIFQMKFEYSEEDAKNNLKNGLLIVEYCALYKPVIIKVK
jgi:hypothetical protein